MQEFIMDITAFGWVGSNEVHFQSLGIIMQ